MTNLQSQLAIQQALSVIDARGVAAGPAAWDGRLKRALEAEQPQGARGGESRYRVSGLTRCGDVYYGTLEEKQFERTVWAPTRREASERAMDLIIWDHGPDYVETTDVTKVT